jgi:hypothetical protein
MAIIHIKTIDHHQGLDLNFQLAPSEPQHLGDMCGAKIQLTLDFVVLFIKGATGDKKPQTHGNFSPL